MEKLTDNEKLNQLTEKRNQIEEKLKNLYKNFRGVRHENSLSELRYSQIRVYEDYLNSLNEEIKALEEKAKA